MPEPLEWQVQPIVDLPEWFVQAVSEHAAESSGPHAAQLLWQRGIRQPEVLAGFLKPDLYQPASPYQFGQAMYQAVERLHQAQSNLEKVAIWGDFDADGITATSVLWEGLGQFFPQNQQLTYFIPNRLTESHGLSRQGIDTLAAQGYQLIITCDTGSTSLDELNYAAHLGIDVIITDHHILPTEHLPVTAVINPRSLPQDHPLANLSGVAVAYKLVEALYEKLPTVPQRPLEALLDLVAIGLIADLVQLTEDCRHLAQRGIEKLQQNQSLNPSPRPGVARLLELCKRNGDRPTDISFGLGPRINAISRIYGDARFCVELLTSQDRERCLQLAEETELANTRRKSLQKDIAQQIRSRLAQLDLSTTSVIVLSDPQWSIGVLGLVAGQIAQEYGRPTILLSTPEEEISKSAVNEATELSHSNILARGSARSIHSIDLYQLVKNQAHLLHSFGGHPFAMGLSLPVENISLFAEAINRQLREQQAGRVSPAVLVADLTVTVAELGKDLFRQLKLLEPCGMGNPVPKLLIQNCWFTGVWHKNIQDLRGRKVQYIKTEFELRDDFSDRSFPGVWWGHYRDEIPPGRCDVIAELDFNSYEDVRRSKRYEIRLIAVRPAAQDRQIPPSNTADWILDWRNPDPNQTSVPAEGILSIPSCPSSWDEVQDWVRRAAQAGQKLAIAYPPPRANTPTEIWQQLVGIAKYLSRTGKTATQTQLCDKLGISDRSIQAGFRSLKLLGFAVTPTAQGFGLSWQPEHAIASETEIEEAIGQFLAMVQEEQFRRLYFYKVPLATIRAVTDRVIRG